jgi:hypothetical protein
MRLVFGIFSRERTKRRMIQRIYCQPGFVFSKPDQFKWVADQNHGQPDQFEVQPDHFEVQPDQIHSQPDHFLDIPD